MTKARTLADNFAADINGITAGTGITGGGTSGTVTITNDMATTIAAKGDLVVGTGNDTYNRLAVASTAGYLLTVDSAETTGLKWAAPAGGKLKNSATSRSTSTQVNTTSSWASASLSASITPTSASNKILILLHIDRFWSGSGSQYSVAQARIKRGSTVIYSEIWGLYTETAIARGMSVDAHYVDSPATTSSTTYSVEFIDSGAGVSATFTGGNITLLEIEGL